MAIIFRAVREQLEHDRIIRILQEKFRLHFDVEINLGDERSATFKLGTATYHPDVILTSRQPPRRVVAVVEVETAESINHLEAMAQWANFSRGKAAFHLYVPDAKLEITRHLCGEHQVKIGQLWSYLPLGEGDEFRFTKVEENEPLPLPPPPRAEAARKVKVGAAAPAEGRPAKAPRVAQGRKAAKPGKTEKAKKAKKAARPSGPARAAKAKPPAAKRSAGTGAKKARPAAKPARPASKKAKPEVRKAAQRKGTKKR